MLLAGTAAAMTGLARLAIAGFAPGGALPVLVLAAFGCGVVGTLFSGRPPSADRAPARPGRTELQLSRTARGITA
jgi:hypothetical protein